MNTQNIEQMYYLYKWVSNSNIGKPHLKIFGRNINVGTAIALKIFDANCLNACDTPVYLGGPAYPHGTIWAYNGVNFLPGSLPLYIYP